MLWTTAAGLAPEDDDGNAASSGSSNTAKDAAARLRQALGSNVESVERYARSKGILGEGEPLEKLDIKWILKGLSNPEQLIEKAKTNNANWPTGQLGRAASTGDTREILMQ